MIVKQIDPHMPDETTINYAARMIRAGAIVVFPSDSSYGMATNPSDREAIMRLFKTKGRDYSQAISCIFRDIEQMKEWAVIGRFQQKVLERNLPGPFTFILESRPGYPLDGNTVGVRIPDYSVTKSLSFAIDQPYTSTSANLSGLGPAYSLDDIYQQFEGKIYQPDLILDAGILPQYPPSAVIDIRENKKIILREGVAKVR